MTFRLFATLGALFSAFRKREIGYNTAKTLARNNKKLTRDERDAAIEKLTKQNNDWYNKNYSPRERQLHAGRQEKFEKHGPPKTSEAIGSRTHKKDGGLVTANKNKKQIKGPYS